MFLRRTLIHSALPELPEQDHRSGDRMRLLLVCSRNRILGEAMDELLSTGRVQKVQMDVGEPGEFHGMILPPATRQITCTN
jgi:hypothetical protein